MGCIAGGIIMENVIVLNENNTMNKSLTNWVFTGVVLVFGVIILAFHPAEKIDQVLNARIVKSAFQGKVKIYELKKEGKSYGHSIWLNRSGHRVKAKYFALRSKNVSVYDRMQSWRQGRNVILACSGAFSTELPGGGTGTTVGLTVDNGRIVNRNIDRTMDGVVIVLDNGGMIVSDIDNKNLEVGDKHFRVIEDKIALLNWAQQHKATIFQTQLLAYQGALRISRAGRKKMRERRFLALVTSRAKGLHHVIIDIPNNEYLFNAARDAFYHLKDDQGMTVVALLNIDTGGFNILELYNERGQRDFTVSGPRDIKLATNLISYSFE